MTGEINKPNLKQIYSTSFTHIYKSYIAYKNLKGTDSWSQTHKYGSHFLPIYCAFKLGLINHCK